MHRKYDDQSFKKIVQNQNLIPLSGYLGYRKYHFVICHCGQKFSILGHRLLNSTIKSCGCHRRLYKHTYHELINSLKENQLILIGDFPKYSSDKIYLQCRCGFQFYRQANLVIKKTKSCGCLCMDKRKCRLSLKHIKEKLKKKNLIYLENTVKPVEERVKIKCYCGKKFTIILAKILHETNSCGCLRAEVLRLPHDDIVKKLQKKQLILLERYKGGMFKHKIKCRCGKIFYSILDIFLNSNSYSCGCYGKIQASKAKSKNCLGLKSGDLTVISYAYNKKHQHYWKCQCSCQKFCYVSSNGILKKNVKSCGNCKLFRNGKQVSRLQLELHKMLGKGKVNFISRKKRIDIATLHYDKFGKYHKVAIEYDGWKWHKDTKYEDQLRNNRLTRRGWKLLVIRSRRTLPTYQQLIDYLDLLVNSKIKQKTLSLL